jgi:DNA-binding HxlR family transcriptional regulator
MVKKLTAAYLKRSTCPIAATLDLVGDKWSLLIIRDIGLFDRHRNKDFQNSDEGIPTNILANRLKRLTEIGLLEKRLYQERPPRYEYHLTELGRALLPVLGAMAKWATDHITGTRLPEAVNARR